MDYREAYRYISSLKRFGGGRGLEAIQRALNSIGNPHLSFPSIHIAGTNGKGSVACILESILSRFGAKVGRYTSPHLLRVNERVRVGCEEIDDETLASGIEAISDLVSRDDLTFFEALTLLAFKVFGDKQIDLGIIEVGLGGRLDATNLVDSTLSIVTNIDRDHTAFLGTELETIAREKLGILKTGVPLVTGIEKRELWATFEEAARERGAPLHFLDDEVQYRISDLTLDGVRFTYRSPENVFVDLRLPLTGLHQVRNTVLAVRAAERLNRKIELNEDVLNDAFDDIDLQGRFHVIRREPYYVVLDVFHNRHGAEAVRKTLTALFEGCSVYLIIGVADDKDLKGIAEALMPVVSEVVAVKPDFGLFDRVVGPADVVPAFREVGIPVSRADTILHARDVLEAKIEVGDVLLVGGSFRTVAEAITTFTPSGHVS